jgi:excisionase family DNA binding protein
MFDQSGCHPPAPVAPHDRERVDEESNFAHVGRRLEPIRVAGSDDRGVEAPDDLPVALGDREQTGRRVVLGDGFEEVDEAVVVGQPEQVRGEVDVVGGAVAMDVCDRRPIARYGLSDLQACRVTALLRRRDQAVRCARAMPPEKGREGDRALLVGWRSDTPRMDWPAPLTVREVAAELRCSEDEVRSLIRDGQLKTVACGIRPGLVPRHVLDDYLRRHRRNSGQTN